MQLRYRVVDVFTRRPLEGNPLAVFPDAHHLDSETMQSIARELNLSETVFLLPPGRDGCISRARIFTPTVEMRFAGHPTVGAAWVLMDEGTVPSALMRFSIDELVGAVPIRVEHGDQPMIWLTTPPIESRGVFEAGLCARAVSLSESDLLGPAPELLSAGNPNLFIALRDREAVDRAAVGVDGSRLLFQGAPNCVFVFCPTSEGAYSRMFAPEAGVVEDPATGSATGPLAAYMMKHGLLSNTAGTRAVSEQGTKMKRRSLLHIQIHGENGREGIEVGGEVTPVIEARLTI